MAIKVIANHPNGVTELMADSLTDKQNLLNGTAHYDVSGGSTCIIVEDSSVLMTQTDGTWKEI